MKFALLGGDDRIIRLCRLLKADGHQVIPFALATPDSVNTPAEALVGAECIVLPLPCEKNGVLNAPFSPVSYPIAFLLESAGAGTPVLAGKVGDTLRQVCQDKSLPLYDYGMREDFALLNAELTAEGALQHLLSLPCALRGSRILIAGYGRIGRALAEKLTALGAEVTVADRSGDKRSEALRKGFMGIPLEAAGEGYGAVVNTIPATVFHNEQLAAFGGALLLELASPPYGFDLDAAEHLGKRVVIAGGLPGKTAPESAAAAVRSTIYAILEEQSVHGKTTHRAGADRLILHI